MDHGWPEDGPIQPAGPALLPGDDRPILLAIAMRDGTQQPVSIRVAAWQRNSRDVGRFHDQVRILETQ